MSIDDDSAQDVDPAVQAAREEQVTAEVLASFEGTPDPRLKQIMQSLTRHLHAFVREVRLTEDEWNAGIEFLTRAGHITDDKRQEYILLSDVLGVSMLTVGINAPARANATESTVFGPFFVENSPAIDNGGDVAEGVPGTPCWVTGTVTSTTGEPIGGARIEVWFADEDGFYDVQYEDTVIRGRAHLHTRQDGTYEFWAITPPEYPIPFDGPVGAMLAATNRPHYRPAHIHFMVTAPGYHDLITHIFVAGNDYLDKDAVFGVKDSLIYDFQHHEPTTAHGRTLTQPWDTVHFPIVLAPTGPGEHEGHGRPVS